MSSSLEFIIVTPEQRSWSQRAGTSLSIVRQHTAKHQHARERARRRIVLLEALNCHQDTTLPPSTQREPLTNSTNEACDCAESIPADKLDVYEHSIHCAIYRNHDTLTNTDLENIKDSLFFHQPEATLFGELGLRKRADKDDVVRYLQYIPSMATGASRDNSFQPVREVTIRAIQASHPVVDWLLLEIASIRTMTDGSAEPVMHALRQRIYRTMNRMLASPTLRCSDELLNMVFAALCIEYRTSTGMDVPRVRIHYKGMEKIIESRGGLASLFGFAATSSHPICCLPYLHFSELEVSDRSQARQCCALFLETLQYIQAFVNNLGRSMTVSQGHTRPNLKYLMHRERLTDSIAEPIAQFLSLYLIALMIWDFGLGNGIADKFLSKLSAVIDDRINPTTKATRLNAHMLTWMTVTAWVDVDASSTWPGCGPQKELWITQAGMNALKVFGRLPDERKDELTALLVDWVCSGCGHDLHNMETEQNQRQRSLSAEYCLLINTECCSDWYEEHVAQKQATVYSGGEDD